VNLDGVYYGQGRIINEGFFDMKQVEILRGPQALFFGKNASAGVISFRSADPATTSRLPPAPATSSKARSPTWRAWSPGR
jgi:outer membrane receptor protein involved in Fe transport